MYCDTTAQPLRQGLLPSFLVVIIVIEVKIRYIFFYTTQIYTGQKLDFSTLSSGLTWEMTNTEKREFQRISQVPAPPVAAGPIWTLQSVAVVLLVIDVPLITTVARVTDVINMDLVFSKRQKKLWSDAWFCKLALCAYDHMVVVSPRALKQGQPRNL